MRVLVTGSRDWTDEFVLRTALDEIYAAWHAQRCEGDQFIVVHGDARGADTLARQWALAKHQHDPAVLQEAHPADWDTHYRAAGHIRNMEMVQAGADICLAFPLGKSPGTRGCMKLARKANIPIKRFQPRSAA